MRGVERGTVTAEIGEAEVIGHDDEDVGSFGGVKSEG